MTEAINQAQLPCNSEINSFLIGYNGIGVDQIDFRPVPESLLKQFTTFAPEWLNQRSEPALFAPESARSTSSGNASSESASEIAELGDMIAESSDSESETTAAEPAEPNLSDLASALATTDESTAAPADKAPKRSDVTFTEVMTAERKRITSEIEGLPSVDLI